MFISCPSFFGNSSSRNPFFFLLSILQILLDIHLFSLASFISPTNHVWSTDFPTTLQTHLKEKKIYWKTAGEKWRAAETIFLPFFILFFYFKSIDFPPLLPGCFRWWMECLSRDISSNGIPNTKIKKFHTLNWNKTYTFKLVCWVEKERRQITITIILIYEILPPSLKSYWTADRYVLYRHSEGNTISLLTRQNGGGGNESKINPTQQQQQQQLKVKPFGNVSLHQSVAVVYLILLHRLSMFSGFKYVYTYIQRATIKENLIILPCLFFIDSAGATAFFYSFLFFPSTKCISQGAEYNKNGLLLSKTSWWP